MTRSVAMPSYLGALSVGNLYRGFTVVHCFLLQLLEDVCPKDICRLKADRVEIVLVAETKPHGFMNGRMNSIRKVSGHA